MNTNPRKTPSWLPELTEQVQVALDQRTAGKVDQRPALEQELEQIRENVQGWNASLAKPKLPDAVREAVEKQWGAAAERQQEIQAELAQLTQDGVRAEQLVEPEQVVHRVERLADVLAAADPTRGNLELSLHIDRITCFHDDRVQLRMCKLGILPDAVELLAMPVVKTTVPKKKEGEGRARRRGKLRVVEDDAEVDLRAQADFVADVDRFAGLSDQWFWIDEFKIPESSSWASENAERVFRRRKAERLSFAKLAEEFGVTPPTIGAAVRAYLEKHPEESDIELPCGGKRKPKFDLSTFADEARQLWIDGESKEKLAKKYGCSAPTVGKAIAFAYEREGLKMPTRAEARRAKVAEARSLLDAGKQLDEIAVVMKVSDVTARQYLRESFAAEGKPMHDLRRRPPLDAA
jgi:hypothetical protein